MRRVALCVALALGCCYSLVRPGLASAQGDRASINGLVQDSSGGVLPGVTVEAASPALIEQSRSVVTDGAGRYAIENLRPGTYVVTFTMPGFRSVKREGIVLEGAFAAQVNASLAVGSVAETLTVIPAPPRSSIFRTRARRSSSIRACCRRCR
jgi:hypothetical protein